MNEIASQETVVSVLRQSLKSDNLPHLLFYGPPGTGKTSTILALARELFGPKLFRSRILELNASDERGIAVIREKVKTFAKVTVRETVPDYPCPPFKLIILDEADSLTADAQTALRRTIEQYSRSTRFCLICNYVSRIIDPLTSRCAKFRFGAVGREPAVSRLREIAVNEAVKFASTSASDESSEVLSRLIERCHGDLRRAVGLLQGAHRLGRPLSLAVIDDLSGYIPDATIEMILERVAGANCGSGSESASDDGLAAFIKNQLIRCALPVGQLLLQLQPHLFRLQSNLGLSNVQLALLMDKTAECEARLVEGADEHVQILNYFMYLRAVVRGQRAIRL